MIHEKRVAKDLCGALVGGIIAGPPGAIIGALICDYLTNQER